MNIIFETEGVFPPFYYLMILETSQQVFEYFTERTPRSHLDVRDTSLVWNYKYADVEFGRLQARDMLQHLWTGPVSSASLDIFQGSRSVEVRALGVTKGSAFDRILGEIVHAKSISTPIDYVLCIGHFLGKDEDVYSFFEPELPTETIGVPRPKLTEPTKPPGERKNPPPKVEAIKSATKSSQKQTNQRQQKSPGKRNSSNNIGNGKEQSPTPEKGSWNVLDLKADNYFSCTVGRTQSNARYLLGRSEDVVSFLKELANADPSISRWFLGF